MRARKQAEKLVGEGKCHVTEEMRLVSGCSTSKRTYSLSPSDRHINVKDWISGDSLRAKNGERGIVRCRVKWDWT